MRIFEDQFYDSENRIVKLRGINFAADAKLPGKGNSYVNSPCSLDEADTHLARLYNLGYNCIRFLFTWEALQPISPDEFDEEYIQFAIALVKKAIAHKFYVIMDPHQDTWSRHSGGSGAPLWTLYAAGFNPKHFAETHAAIIWDPNDEHAIKMQWASNYFRLVSQTMFTLFFGGEVFAPKAQINGINIGTYLRDHYFAALRHFMEAVNNANLGTQFLGWESLNEPGHGLIGWPNLAKLSKNPAAVRLGTSPTPFQGMLLGQGIAQHVRTYKFTGFGIKRLDSSFLVNPLNSAWFNDQEMAEIDEKYGWQRSYKSGCIWELHGIYDSKTKKLLKPDYFKPLKVPARGESREFAAHLDPNAEVFIEHFFVGHWTQFKFLVEEINPNWFKFMQSPVNAPPPTLIHSSAIDSKTVYSPHFYDGLTLLLKKWRFLNVDAIGVMRAFYNSPLKALRLGDAGIARSFADQFAFLRLEGQRRLGKIPMVMTEIGIPFDMNKKHAYTRGHWTQQIRALDANLLALERQNVDYCLWCFCVKNTHACGDNFAGEDLSIWSTDDQHQNQNESNWFRNGVRAPQAVLRPGVIAAAGEILLSQFDLRRAEYTLRIQPAAECNAPTLVYAPKYYLNNLQLVEVSSGELRQHDEQTIAWDHGSDKVQELKFGGCIRFTDNENFIWTFIKEKLSNLIESLTASQRKQLSMGAPTSMIDRAHDSDRGDDDDAGDRNRDLDVDVDDDAGESARLLEGNIN